MAEYLRDLYGHQAWADAELWRAICACAPATADEAICQRLHHIHLVQHAFLSIVQHEAVRATTLDDFAGLDALREHARAGHARAEAYLAGTTDEQRQERLTIPWFRDPPIEITVEQALLQAAMHSHYHRGQNATRLRELGGNPPLTDLIVWYWKGRPSPVWD
jgi:uncharacterized damage-inducible protein DinB